MASVTIPPWINIDPIEPARIRIQANAQRNAAAASERAAQMQAQELQFRREQLQAQQAMAAEREAGDERAALRRDQVLRQTNDRELAQAAGQMQLRREYQAQRADQFEKTLRLKQQAAEGAAMAAAKQMQGLQAYTKALKEGRSEQEALAENAPLIFYKNPSTAVGALHRSRVAAVPDYVAHELMTEQGTPTGVMVRRGAGGSVVPLPRTEMTPEGRIRQDQLLAGIYSQQLETATGDEAVALQKKLTAIRDRIEKDIEQRATSGRGAVASPAGVNALSPAAAPAPMSDTVRVVSPGGNIGTLPRAKWESSTEEQKKGWKLISPMASTPDFTEESDAVPADEEQ